jgi:branched-chain amino acid transport system ATP-binding protein
MTAALACAGLDAGYVAGRPVVRNFDLSIERGQIVALLGPNGAGKTTLLMTIAGLLPALGGSVAIGGQTVKNGSPRAAVKSGLVLVPDDRALFNGLTVTENLRLAGHRRGTSIDAVLDYFPALKQRLKVAAGALSGGEQQMLAIGRALMQDPGVLLVDELSMGLAPVIVQSLLPIIARVAKETGAAVILVEQHVMLALGVADVALVLTHGEVALRGDAADLAAHEERIELAYLGVSSRPA